MTIRHKLGPRATEAQLHRTIAGWLTLHLMPPAWFTTFPAGGGGQLRGQLLKASGLKAGVPDILVIHQGIARWVELKTEKGRLSDAQYRTMADLGAAGCITAVVRSLDEMIMLAGLWGLPIRTVSPSTERLRAALAKLED